MTQDLGVVHTNIPRPDPAAIKKLSEFSVATVHEAQGRTGMMRPYMRPAYPHAHLCGRAVTALLQPGDNWMLHVAAEQVTPGDVVVAGCITESTDGFFGELLATSMRAQGAEGIVIDGGVRDTRALAEMNFPTFSRAISSKGTVKATLGSVNVPVVCAHTLVNPGDVVVADDDGVVVVPHDCVAEVAKECQDREDREAIKRSQFQNGELGLDLYNMREALVDKGLRYEP